MQRKAVGMGHLMTSMNCSLNNNLNKDKSTINLFYCNQIPTDYKQDESVIANI